TIWLFFRDASAESAQKLCEQAKKVATGAGLMTNTEVAVEVLSAVWPLRCNRTLAELLHRNIEAVGVPAWTGEEETLARTLQANANVGVEGVRRDTKTLKGGQRRPPAQ